jgi:hypothetical protein
MAANLPALERQKASVGAAQLISIPDITVAKHPKIILVISAGSGNSKT